MPLFKRGSASEEDQPETPELTLGTIPEDPVLAAQLKVFDHLQIAESLLDFLPGAPTAQELPQTVFTLFPNVVLTTGMKKLIIAVDYPPAELGGDSMAVQLVRSTGKRIKLALMFALTKAPRGVSVMVTKEFMLATYDASDLALYRERLGRATQEIVTGTAEPFGYPPQEPSMEEILGSIRRIIADEECDCGCGGADDRLNAPKSD